MLRIGRRLGSDTDCRVVLVRIVSSKNEDVFRHCVTISAMETDEVSG